MKKLARIIAGTFYIVGICAANHYSTLGVRRTASEQEIRKAYRMLALKCHPDKVEAADKKAASERFRRISEAYETLSDPTKRRGEPCMCCLL